MNFHVIKFMVILVTLVDVGMPVTWGGPKGGKRISSDGSESFRPCPRCGPRSQGKCIGPQICCSDQFGCHINTPDTAVCVQENHIPDKCVEPMQPYGSVPYCGVGSIGSCAADGVCCTTDTCMIDTSCSTRLQRSARINYDYKDGVGYKKSEI